MAEKSHQRSFGSINQALTILCLFVAIKATWGDLIQEPNNTVVTLNSSATLECRVSENGMLLWYSFRNNFPKTELWNGQFLDPEACACPCCKIDGSEPGKLKITARREIAKQYMCSDMDSQKEASVYLIVIESALNCTYHMYNKTDKDVALSCAIGFYGEWEPQIKWNRSDGGQVKGAAVSVKDGQVTSVLTMPLTTVKVYYTASVYFNVSDRPDGVTASNVPVYQDEWTSPPFQLNVSESSGNAIAIALPYCLAAVVTLAQVYILFQSY